MLRIRLRGVERDYVGFVRQGERDELAEILIDIGHHDDGGRQRWVTFAYDDVLTYAVEPAATSARADDVDGVAAHLEVFHPGVDPATIRRIAATAVRLGAKPPNRRRDDRRTHPRAR